MKVLTRGVTALNRWHLVAVIGSAMMAAACATGGSATSGIPMHNEAGSTAVNEKENVEYSKALLRCHKTGGTRIVKIEGNLRCF